MSREGLGGCRGGGRELFQAFAEFAQKFLVVDARKCSQALLRNSCCCAAASREHDSLLYSILWGDPAPSLKSPALCVVVLCLG